MSRVYIAPVLSAALEKFKKIVAEYCRTDIKEKRLVVFCEDRLSLVAERAVCDAAGGTFSVSVYTLSRFLATELKSQENVLTSQGSAMAIRKLIEEHREELQLFKKLSAANAAQQVYDTIALLYSSKISPDDLCGVEAESRLLKRKLHDLELLYREYSAYLGEHGAVDRNAYLRRLPEVISRSEKLKDADVLFLGFQAFTSSVADCVKACMQTCGNVYGIFIGGREKKYVNEAWATFAGLAEECGVADKNDNNFIMSVPSGLNPLAEHLRKFVFEPEIFHKRVETDIVRGQLTVCEAEDEEEESRFIAAQVLKCVKEGGVRYREISVMVPDIAAVQPALERAFGEYGIPMYVDRRYPLVSHSVCSFVLDYLACAIDGCRQESVFAVVNSPLFPSEGKDIFINYMLRAATFRGGVKKQVKREICEEAGSGLDYDTAEKVRQTFLKGLSLINSFRSKESACSEICAAVRGLLDSFNAEERLKRMAEEAEACGYNSVSAMSARAYGCVLQVLDEAEKLTAGDRLSLREFAKILKSGFTAAEVSLIQPKQDAVFISDLSKCANAGSKVLFIGGLTDAVPAASQDTAVLTDGELSSMEKLKLAVSPKISQVNRRVKEITALNLCSFTHKLYLVYPLRSGGEACGVSEIIDYVRRLCRVDGNPLRPVPVKQLSLAAENFVYACARPAPALRYVNGYLSGDREYSERSISAVYKYLCGADGAAFEGGHSSSGGTEVNWRLLYGDSVSPTSLETYYSCPYKAFMQQGLRLAERREGAFRPLDSGNFIHAVLEKIAPRLNDIKTADECADVARECALNIMNGTAFAVQEEDGGAVYAAEGLIAEAQKIAVGMFAQIKNSAFKVELAESRCTVDLGAGITVGGRIDRVDSCGDMVRVIDYKTGNIDDSPASYYMGLKLQLPLYLSAVSGGRRAAGAYYFPANLEYSSDGVGAFTLRGFMDGSGDVVRSSDAVVEEKGKSAYVGAYLNGRSVDRAMTREDFSDFIDYSKILAENGALALTCGEIAPSPAEGTCEYCKYNGCCGFDAESNGGRESVSADCKTIAAVARRAKGKKEGGQ